MPTERFFLKGIATFLLCISSILLVAQTSLIEKASKGADYWENEVGLYYLDKIQLDSAVFWLEKCAPSHQPCFRNLGQIVLNKRNYEFDRISYFKTAHHFAHRDSAEMYDLVGYCYFYLVDTFNLDSAKYWVRKSARNGNIDAAEWMCNLSKRGVYDKNPGFTYREAEDDCLWLAAIAQNEEDKRQIAEMYFFEGYGDFSNEERILGLLSQANEANNSIAQYLLGDVYMRGMFDMAIDMEKAYRYSKMAYDNGQERVTDILESCYLTGIGTKKDTMKAFEIRRKSAKTWDARSRYLLGIQYYLTGAGSSVEQNLDSAFYWVRSSVDEKYLFYPRAGLGEAHFTLGLMYFNGWGTEKNMKMAAIHVKKAMDIGHPQAAKVYYQEDLFNYE